MQAFHRTNLLRWWVTSLLAVAFAIRVFTLTSQSLWRDEVDALRFATASWPELLSTFTRPGWNGPLYFALLRGWIGLTGRSEFALRYLSLWFGVLAVAFAFVFARRLAGTATALLCAVFFALSPYFIWYSQEVKMYTLILAMATLAIYVLRRAVESNRVIWWATLGVATSVAFYSHILAALMIPVEMILAVVWGIGSRSRQWWIGALVSFACLTFPYLPLLRWQLPLVFARAETGYPFYPLDQMSLVMVTGFATGVSGRLTDLAFELAARVSVLLTATASNTAALGGDVIGTATLWPAGLLLVIGAMAGQARWRDKAVLMIWLCLPLLALYFVSLNRPIFTDRYLIWIGPAFYLLVASGAVALWRLWKPLGLVTTLAAVSIAVTGIYFQAATPIKSDFRGATHYFEAHRSPDDLVIFQIPYVRYTFEYYYHPPYDWAEGLFTNYGMSDAEVDSQMRPIVAGHKTLWLVASEMEMWDRHLQVWKWLETHARRTDTQVFAQVTLYRYEF